MGEYEVLSHYLLMSYPFLHGGAGMIAERKGHAKERCQLSHY